MKSKESKESKKYNRLIHNYYIDFMINLKDLMQETFDDTINSFEFNYGSKTLHQYNLYRDLDRKYPKCTINITDLNNSDNSQFRNNKVLDSNMFQNLAINTDKKEIISVAYRWVDISFDISIAFENGMDVLNYNDYLLQRFPLNSKHYINKYDCFLDVTNFTDWDINEKTDNIFYRLTHTSNEISQLSKCNIEPIYTINSINKKVDNIDMKFALTTNFIANLKIPTLLKLYNDEGIVKDIIVSIGLKDEEFEHRLKPDPVIVSDNTFDFNNIIALFLLDKDSVDIESETIKLEMGYETYIQDKPIALTYEDIFIDINPNDYYIKDNYIYLSNKYKQIKKLINIKKNTESNIDFKNLKLVVYK